jgi:hypothetical protein
MNTTKSSKGLDIEVFKTLTVRRGKGPFCLLKLRRHP